MRAIISLALHTTVNKQPINQLFLITFFPTLTPHFGWGKTKPCVKPTTSNIGWLVATTSLSLSLSRSSPKSRVLNPRQKAVKQRIRTLQAHKSVTKVTKIPRKRVTYMWYSNDTSLYMFKAEFVTLISLKVPSGGTAGARSSPKSRDHDSLPTAGAQSSPKSKDRDSLPMVVLNPRQKAYTPGWHCGWHHP